ncbi:putative MATE family efflux protein [Anaerosolibacter carboniphilus]|uniref:Probable multidrug resistance protein NorM n=1 Tax=Anaerosolibacter carboniphilus TaxID=1417629 RepID=A0A841KWV3_9FIRM|nr:MATE family efflux transporter [Anaerosolibacter carboniphilus]MBB6214655.1 putative MATE family efflux protein [Anaerosolibacter carboniphilus]
MVVNTLEIRNNIFKLAGPAILEMTLQTLVWTVDTAMIGRLDPASISAVALGAQMMFITMAVFGSIGIGATAMVARNVGAEDLKRGEKVAAQALTIAIVISILLSTLGILFSKEIFAFVVDDTQLIAYGSIYLRYVLIGGFFLIPLGVSNAILRGAGNTVVPLKAALFANIFNIVGDYVLIFGKWGFPQLGVKGAAIATGLAQMLGAFISLYYLFSGRCGIKVYVRDLFILDKEILSKLFRLSIPAAFEITMNDGSRLLSSFWIAKLGIIHFAANAVAVAAESISFMPGYGFAIAATTLMGQRLGAQEVDVAHKSTMKSVQYAVILMGIVAILFFAVPRPIMALFTSDPETLDLAARCIRVGALEQIPIAIAMVISGALKGAGDTKGPFYISLATNLGVRLPLIFAIVFFWKLSIVYVWIATALQFTLEAVLMILRYKRGKWKTLEI